MSAIRRKDNKGRVLNENEFQKADGRYEYRYRDCNDVLRSVYSWRLTESDRLPKGKRECKPLRELEVELSKAEIDEIDVFTARHTTLNEYFELNMANRNLRKTTRNNYIYMYNTYVRNGLGMRALTNFKPSTFKTFYNDLITVHNFKPNSMEVLHTILHPIFEDAVEDGLIKVNPTTGAMKKVRKSKDWVKTPKREALTLEQQKAFMGYINDHSTYKKWVRVFTFFFGTGLRVSEFCGLTWDNCNFRNNTITVEKNLVYRPVYEFDSVKGEIKKDVGELKTMSSERVIPMFTEVRNALLAEKERQERERIVPTEICGVSNWVFLNRYHSPFLPASINRAIDRIVADYNREEKGKARAEKREPLLLPKFTAHIMRHTFCTRLCENEPRVKIIQDIMGHSSIRTTMDIYNTVSEKLKRDSIHSLQGNFFIA